MIGQLWNQNTFLVVDSEIQTANDPRRDLHFGSDLRNDLDLVGHWMSHLQ